MAIPLGANHLDQNIQWEPQRSNNGILRIYGADFGGQKSQDLLELAVASFPVPKSTTNITEVRFVNEGRKYAGNRTYDDLSVVFKDYVDAGVARLLNSWYLAVHNPKTGATGLAVHYKRQAEAILFAPDGTFERSYQCVGLWPSALDPGDVDYASDEPINMTVTFTIDKVIPGDMLLDESKRGVVPATDILTGTLGGLRGFAGR